MTLYNTLNVKLSNSWLKKLKPEKKNGTEITFKVLSNVVAYSINQNNVSRKLLLTNTRESRTCKAFAFNSLANINLSKT